MGNFLNKIQEITNKNLYHDKIVKEIEFKKLLKEIKHSIKSEAKKGHTYYNIQFRIHSQYSYEAYAKVFDYLKTEGFLIKTIREDWLCEYTISW